MARYRCNSCGGTYSGTDAQGVEYYHQCPEGTVTPRDENPEPGTVVQEGKEGVLITNANDVNDVRFVPRARRVKKAGSGRTQL